MEEYIEDRLIELADEKYKKFQSKICTNVDNMIGVRIPLLRKLAKEIYNEYGMEYFNHVKSEYYEEVMLEGIIIGLLKLKIEDVLKYVENFVPKINNWAICDTFCSELKITRKNKKVMWNFLEKYLDSDKEYELRFAIVMMIYYFLDDEYTIAVSKRLDKIKHDGYYVKVAIAWAISMMYVKYPAFTVEYLENCSLDKDTYNKAIQKINESRRVSEEEKVYIRYMKKI